MAELTAMMASDEWEGEHNFALRNIHSQIQLTYGKEYGLYGEYTGFWNESEASAATSIMTKSKNEQK